MRLNSKQLKSPKSGTIIAGLILFSAAVNIPFLNQAFHMDDGIYLMMAKNIESSFWFPQDRPSYFEGLYVGDLASTEHPWPVTSYLLAACAHIAGGYSETAMHLAFLIFPLIIAVSMYCLASRFTKSPIYATLALLTLPAVSVLSHTVMTDIPQLAFWIASSALFCRGVDTGKKLCAWMGAFAAAIACLISYSGLCLVPLLGFYALLRKNRRELAPILILPAGLLGLVLAVNSYHFGRFTPDMLLGYYFLAKRVLSPALLAEKSIFAVLATGAAAFFPAILLARYNKRLIPVSLAGALAAGLLSGASGYRPIEKLVFVLLFWAGIFCVTEIAREALTSVRRSLGGNRDELFLVTWFFGMGFFMIGVYMNGSARYMFPATPPLILLLFRKIDGISNERSRRRIAIGTVTLSAVFGILLAAADYQFAGIYREFASSISRTLSNPKAKLFFAGEWGFRVYLERAGGRELGRRDSSPKPGDLLAVPTLATPYQTLFSDILGLESMAMAAPSRVSFEIPRIPPDCLLIYTIGMPFHDKSDGMEFSVLFSSSGEEKVLARDHMTPQQGKEWQVRQIPLTEIAGTGGILTFAADIGSSGDADADWAAIARAHISRRNADKETTIFNFQSEFKFAQIQGKPGIRYHTDRNLPVLPMMVWLKQNQAATLRARYNYTPAFPLRLLDRDCHAGFWSSGWGLLPFSVARKQSVLESISVYEITRAVDAFGESDPAWYGGGNSGR